MSSRRCVVIGAGILGASVAARLAAAGLRVTLLDQDEPGRATSRWSFAWINSNDKAPRPYHDLNHAGMRAWAELAPDLDGNAWYRPSGHVELATAGTGELEARVKRLTEWGYPARLISPAEASELEPALRLPAPAAAFFPDEGYLLTEPLIARLVAHAESHGAQVLTGEPGRVTSIDTSGDAPPRVRTAAGAVLEADEVICCAGRWTPSLAAVPLVPWQSRRLGRSRARGPRRPRRPAGPGPAAAHPGPRPAPASRRPAAPGGRGRRGRRGPAHPRTRTAPLGRRTPPPCPPYRPRPRRRPGGGLTRSASARCPPTASPSWAASPALRASTSRSPTAA